MKALHTAYAGTTPASIMIAERDLLNLVMEPEESILAWSTRVQDEAGTFEDISGQKVPVYKRLQILTDGLPESFDAVVAVTLSKLEDEGALTWSSAVSILTKQEQRMQRTTRSALIAFKAAAAHQNGSNTRNPVIFPPRKPEHKYTVCPKCAKLGHSDEDCRS